MTYSFGRRSMMHRETIDPRLQSILDEAIKYIDFSIICGHRDEVEQNIAFNSGNSKLRWPRSKHNSYPSKAVDIAPYPIDWSKLDRFYYLAGVLMGIALARGVKLRYGGDWSRDGDITDEHFRDLVHFQIDD